MLRALTLAIHVCIKVQLSDMIGRRCLEPNTLPDAAARGVKDVARAQGLLSDWNNIIAIICRIMDEDKPAVGQHCKRLF